MTTPRSASSSPTGTAAAGCPAAWPRSPPSAAAGGGDRRRQRLRRRLARLSARRASRTSGCSRWAPTPALPTPPTAGSPPPARARRAPQHRRRARARLAGGDMRPPLSEDPRRRRRSPARCSSSTTGAPSTTPATCCAATARACSGAASSATTAASTRRAMCSARVPARPLYRRGAVLAVGGFDERYFAYLEDVDLALALRRAGWRCRYVPAVALHAGEGSSPAAGAHHFYVQRNTLLLIAKAFPLRWLRWSPTGSCRGCARRRANAGSGSTCAPARPRRDAPGGPARRAAGAGALTRADRGGRPRDADPRAGAAGHRSRIADSWAGESSRSRPARQAGRA